MRSCRNRPGHGQTIKNLSPLLRRLPLLILLVSFTTVVFPAEQHYDIYEVRPGDTLTRIAAAHNITVTELAQINNITNPSLLRVGQKIKIPSRQTTSPEKKNTAQHSAPAYKIYTIQKGDTLYSIAKKHQIPLSELLHLNNLSSNDIVKIGQQLKIPQPSTATSQPPSPTTPQPTPPPTAATPQKQPPEVTSPPPQPPPQPVSPPLPTPPPSVESPPDATADYHIVQAGENLSSIAKKYALDVEQLRQWNNLQPGKYLRVGQRLRLSPPGGTTEEDPPPADAPSAPQRPYPAQRLLERARTTGIFGKTDRPPPAFRTAAKDDTLTYVYIRPVKDQIDSARIKPGRWRYVVIHHSETPSGNAAVFDRFHRNVRKWENGLAYHFVIGNGRGSGDGEIEVGHRWIKQLAGGHLRSAALNDISIGICLVGSFNVERPTARQIAATIELVQYLRRICGNPRLEFTVHRRINPTPTDCPGRLFPERMMFQRLR